MNFRDVLMAAATAGSNPGWKTAGAVMDADFANERYYWNGFHVDETAFLAAIGGTKSGITRTIGPYVDPTGTTLLTNGTFTGGVTGWSGSNSGAIAGVANELELTASGSLQGFAQSVSNIVGRGFRLRATGRRGTSTNDVFLRNAVVADLSNAATVGSTGFTSTSPTTVEGYMSANTNPTYIGGRNSSASGSGTHYCDDFTMVEAWPFQGWTPNAITIAVNATTPASIASNEVVFQADATSERDRIRIVRQSSDSHVVVILTANNNVQASLDLGTVNDSTAFGVSVTCAPNSISASLNGGAPSTDLIAIVPGCTHMRIGRSVTGETWTGTIERVTVL